MPAPLLVLLPGMDGTGILFEPFLAALAGDIETQVVAFPPAEPLGYRELVSRVEAILPQRPFVILAESFSGPIAISVAARQPRYLRGLVLAGTFAETPRKLPRWVARLPFWKAPTHAAAFAIMGRGFDPEARDAIDRAIAPVAPDAWRARMQAVLDVQVMDRVGEIEVQMLCIHGRQDRLVPASSSTAMVRAARCATFESIDGPHSLLYARPVETAAIVAPFTRRVLAR